MHRTPRTFGKERDRRLRLSRQCWLTCRIEPLDVGRGSIASIPRCTRGVRSSPDNGHSLPAPPLGHTNDVVGFVADQSRAVLRPYLLLIATLARPRLVEQVQRRIDFL